MGNLISVNISGVTKVMLKTKALNNISGFFDSGLIHAVLGPDGAGKTTLMRLIAGLLKANAGSVSYISNNINLNNVKNYLGYFPQEQSLYPDLTCQEHLEFLKELYALNDKDFMQKSNQLYEATSMLAFKEHKAGALSGGMYKKLGLMCVLLNKPDLLLLDEPTIGVDPVSRRELWDLIYSFAKDNMTVIMTTSYMDEAEKVDKIHVLNEGRLLVSGKPKELLEKYHLGKIEDIFFEK
jgi:ABC-2 type transport system ATP-binding protein